ASMVSGPRAERILARRRLYGVGTGGDLPRVRNKKSSNSKAEMSASNLRGYSPPASPDKGLSSSQSLSSLSTLGQTSFYQNFNQSSSIMTSNTSHTHTNSRKAKPRYAHDAMYNVITFPNDPNKVFYNVTPTGETPNFPPWYVGHQNTTTKPSDIPSTANRYGNRGAYAMKLRHIDRNSTRITGGGSLPEFLDKIDFTNEWAPKLNAAPHKPNGAMFCSPKDWPENSVYPTGFKKKAPPSSHAYKRETTVLHRPTTTPDRRLLHTAEIDDDETVQMQNSISFDRSQGRVTSTASLIESRASKISFLSRPRTQNMMRIQSEGMIPQRNMQYSGNQLIIKPEMPMVFKEPDPLAVETFNIGRKKAANDHHANKWSQVTRFIKVLFSTSRNLVVFDPTPVYLSGVNNLDIVMHEFKAMTRFNKHATLIYRDQFIQAVTSKVDGMSQSMANSLFSAFDVAKKNCVHYATVLACSLIISKPDQSSLDCLTELWRLYEVHKGSYMAMDNACDILGLVCNSLEEMELMEKTLKKEFRPTCYRLAASATPHGEQPIEKPKKKMPRVTFNKFKKNGQDPAASIKKELEKAPLRPTTTTFNLCNGIMDQRTFVAACRESPRTVGMFEEMRNRLLTHGVAKMAAPKKSVNDRVKDIQSRRVSLAI
ncbi:hypothetical protein TL16_g11068, partial [Triparma laevis f. inornata]